MFVDMSVGLDPVPALDTGQTDRHTNRQIYHSIVVLWCIACWRAIRTNLKLWHQWPASDTDHTAAYVHGVIHHTSQDLSKRWGWRKFKLILTCHQRCCPFKNQVHFLVCWASEKTDCLWTLWNLVVLRQQP